MSTTFHEQRDERTILERVRRVQRLRRRRQRRKELVLRRALEIFGWLAAFFIFVYAAHAALA